MDDMKIDIFKRHDIASFGGFDLRTNIRKAEDVSKELTESFRVHNHSNTQFSWHNFILNHLGGMRNLRQITAEINKKTLALAEAKYNYSKEFLRREIIEARLANTPDPLARRELEIEKEHIEDSLAATVAPIEGAAKDILLLKKAYDEILEAYDGYTESDLEAEEIAYWIKRLIHQSLCDMRETGTISRGNQEALFNIGVNVSLVKKKITEYIQLEEASQDPSNTGAMRFLDECVTLFSNAVATSISVGGFKKGQVPEVAMERLIGGRQE